MAVSGKCVVIEMLIFAIFQPKKGLLLKQTNLNEKLAINVKPRWEKCKLKYFLFFI
ncbi:hypothetical protein FEM08_22960 [Flavobacterium gilvum]|nr:hypothetical protein FEM08_22960 [Flavobacterium gilvum]